MKIFHVADTHLGYMCYKKISPKTGLNQREEDIYSAFREFVDIAVSERPDLILHAGDLFNSVRPSNRAIAFAFDQISRLSSAKIPFVLISGNHEDPRLRETGSIFQIFEQMPDVYPVFRSRMECIRLDIRGVKTVIFALPHISSQEQFQAEMSLMQQSVEQADKDRDVAIALLHGSLAGIPSSYTTGQFNELTIGGQIMDAGFDYVALGHFHKRTDISHNCAYSGSLERLSFGEVGQPKGFIELDLDVGKCVKKFRAITTRKMLDLGGIDASHMRVDSLMEKIVARVQQEPLAGAIARLKIYSLAKELYDHLDFQRLEKLTSSSLYFQFNWTFSDNEQMAGDCSSQFQGLLTEFQQFIDDSIVEEVDKDKLKQMGMDYLKRAGVMK